MTDHFRVQGAPISPPSQVFVPVVPFGLDVVDNGGDTICHCFTPELARKIAHLINADAGVANLVGRR